MPTRIGAKEAWIDKVGFVGVLLALGLLFVALMQPVWRGDEMVKEYKDKCALAEGKMYERKSWLGGTVYECIQKGNV